MSSNDVVGTCQHCKTEVRESQIERWCSGCYKPLSETILSLLPAHAGKQATPTDGTPPETAPGAVLQKTAEVDTTAYLFWAGISLAASIIFTIFGVYRMYTYDSGDRIVGGDAYNYTILATRGVGYICIGIICAIISCFWVLVSINQQIKAR